MRECVYCGEPFLPGQIECRDGSGDVVHVGCRPGNRGTAPEDGWDGPVSPTPMYATKAEFEKEPTPIIDEEVPEEMVNPKDRIGVTKVPFHLVPSGPLADTALVMGGGAVKYGPYNWRSVGVNHTVYVSATIRHLTQHLEGQDLDAESGLPHLAHAAATCMILMDSIMCGNDKDDRPPNRYDDDWLAAANAEAKRLSEGKGPDGID